MVIRTSLSFFAALILIATFSIGNTCAGQTPAGQPWYWGQNNFGLFGDEGNVLGSTMPTPGLSAYTFLPKMIVGDQACTLLLTSSGNVIQLYNNMDAITVSGLTDIVEVSEDDGLCCARDGTGRVWYWHVDNPQPIVDSNSRQLDGIVNIFAGEYVDSDDNSIIRTCIMTRSDGSVWEYDYFASFATSLTWLSDGLMTLSESGSNQVVAARICNGADDYSQFPQHWLFTMSDSTLVYSTTDNFAPGQTRQTLRQVCYSGSPGVSLSGVIALAADEYPPQLALTNNGQLWALDLFYAQASPFNGPWGNDKVRAIYANDCGYMAVTANQQGYTRAWFWAGDQAFGDWWGGYCDTIQQMPGTENGGVLWGQNRLGAVAGVGDGGAAYIVDTFSGGSVWVWKPIITDFGQPLGSLVSGWDEPQQLPISFVTSNVVAVSIGEENGLRLLTDGTVTAGGSNELGLLGNSIPWANIIPEPYFQVSAISNAIDVASGTFHSLALSSGGTVWSWGDNEYGQLGDGNGGSGITNPQASIIPNLNNVAAIAAGGFQSLAIQSSSAVLQWGSATCSYDAMSGSSQYLTPSPVLDCSGNPVFGEAISAGLNHALVLKNDQTVWAWGDNSFGQLGDEQNEPFSSSAVQVLTFDESLNLIPLTCVIAIAAGDNFSLALTNSGTVYAWGDNKSCQCGQALDENHNPQSCTVALPFTCLSCSGVDFSGSTIITGLAAGSQHALALTESGTVWAWGDDSYGQLGDGGIVQKTIWSTASAVPVLNSSGSSLIENVFFITAGGFASAAVSSSAGKATFFL